MAVMFDEEAALREYTAGIRQEVTEEVTEKVTRKNTENSIRMMVEVLKSLAQTKENIVKIIGETYSLQPQIAADKVALYW